MSCCAATSLANASALSVRSGLWKQIEDEFGGISLEQFAEASENDATELNGRKQWLSSLATATQQKCLL